MTDDRTPNDESDDDRSAIEAARREKLRKISELGHDPWGGRFDDRQWIGDISAKAGEVVYRTESGETVQVPELSKIEVLDKKSGRPMNQWVVGEDQVQFRQWVSEYGKGEFVGPQVRAAGRVVLSRDKGKLQFIDIQDMTGRLQLFVGKQQVGDENWDLVKCIDLGDIIGVDGQLRRTRTGELSIFAKQIHFLTKTIEPPPEKYKGLTDLELRQRMRYVDLTYGDGVLQRFVNRTQIVQSIRSTLAQDQFLEIEGPTLHSIAGGAAARPFKTHHNALGLELFMRIALELHLKRLLVGGMERVYELGRVYRNEGISPRHNPEFTMLEVYQAFGDYGSMMDLTERLIVDAIDAIGGQYLRPWGDSIIDFTPPFARKTYHELFAEHTGVDPDDHAGAAQTADKLGFETAGKHPDVVKNFLFEEKVEDSLKGPVFVIDYPASICPLTKRKRDDPAIAERFELFIEGMEIANAYTELNDPDLQEELFQTQLDGLPEEDSMARMDTDFIRALRHGMPPAGGLGVGIDRLVMLLTNSQTIRDVILFPLLRPDAK
ncbi:MAG TPA: lysine--tRNA ligase [Pirellulaceae bacterium]|jgi:lysyl-tRNA synthetase class 2|nr:lysine--tRNA ligase [Pirellulaceae bacterium]